MEIKDFIAPCNKTHGHSIKEAVVTVFLVTPIIKPSRFQKLIENELKDHFQQFQRIAGFELQFSNEQNAPPVPKFEDAGFAFIAFEKGKMSRVLQAKNEQNRFYISFHSHSYTRWQNFFDEYIKVIKIISNHHPDIFVSAVSLHYNDQLQWVSNQEIDLSKIFKLQNDWLPNIFFTSKLSNYQILTQTDIENITYNNRVEITINEKTGKEISISHNISRQLDDVIQLSALVESESFASTLEKEHIRNKDFLKNILIDPIQAMIKLNNYDT